jgi:hypothetical protein
MFRRILTVLFIFAIVLALPAGAAAQSYSFRLSKEIVHVYWNADGSMAIDYLLTFQNDPGAHVIDFVDVGTPSSSYDGSQVKADVNGNPVDISSDYQGTGSGFAVDMGGYAIQPGQSGTVHIFIGKVNNVLYNDDEDQAYASAVFEPTYFDGSFVSGDTDLTVTFHLPPGVKPEEPRWHSAPSGFPSEPQAALDAQGRVTYTWYNPSASGSSSYEFGASFPKSYVPAEAIYTAPPAPPIDFDAVMPILFFCCFGIFFFGIPVMTAIQGQRRKLQYMPPRVALEGHGIKRGLTAVEAAILLEQPLDKVMTMILFAAIKKGAAEVVTRNPLEVKGTVPLPEGLHPYEQQFIEAFTESAGAARQKSLQTMTVALVKQVSEKLRGFSRKETVDYYKSIMERAWQQVEAANTPEVQSQKLDEAMEWTMLDRDYDDRMRRTIRGPIYVPMWWGRYDPTFSPSLGGSTARSGSGMPSTSGRASLPGADFAASMVTGVQTFSSKVIGDLNTFTSKVTNATNPPPKPAVGSSSRSGGGKSGGCACACACAGCACACAGGGR